MAMERYETSRTALYHADCMEALALMPDCSVDAVVTDPPAGIGFMGKTWDTFDRAGFVGFLTGVMKECLRVLKPGGHAVVWSIPRTSHWTGWAMEDAGFEVRDCVLHLFGSGFPKSLDVSKAIDKAAGEQWERIRGVRSGVVKDTYAQDAWSKEFKDSVLSSEAITDTAKQWSGWGTALKPAAEFWWLCRKPLEGTVAENVQKWGTGAMNIDGCRVESDGENPSISRRASHAARVASDPNAAPRTQGKTMTVGADTAKSTEYYLSERPGELLGRWPANVTHDGSNEVLAAFPDAPGQMAAFPDAPGQMADLSYTAPSTPFKNSYGKMNRENEASAEKRYADNGGTNFAAAPGQRRFDSGSAARFFYCAKASSSERGRSNDHPTVKPIDLMRWLCRLVTPPDGTILDCFAGSGSTLVAAREEGFYSIGIEREAKYVEIIRYRLAQEVLF